MRKIHKWFGIVLTLFILMFALSGIILNHRETFARFNISRNLLPDEYSYKNWNNASLQGQLLLSNDSILVYGNTGIWLTDSIFNSFKSYNQGFGQGVDRRKITSLVSLSNKKLFAGTQFGLFTREALSGLWERVEIPSTESRITDLLVKGDSLFVLTRSQLFVSNDMVHFNEIKIAPPEGYDNKVSLFRTLWVVHSGAIYSLPGKLIVDAVALIFVWLCISGIIFWIKKSRIKALKKQPVKLKSNRKAMQFLLRWHNRLGWTTVVLLLISTLTGMFLRPPLLLAIMNGRVSKIPLTTLADANPWFDKLRKMSFDAEDGNFLLATSEGIYELDKSFVTKPLICAFQPPVSVMGITVMQKLNQKQWLIGSFEGLFAWNRKTGEVIDYISGTPYQPAGTRGKPTGTYLVSGYLNSTSTGEVFFDYNHGAGIISPGGWFPEMPASVQSSPMSIWNLALEIHTARILGFLLGDFYILVVPLAGLSILLILFSGFVVWYKHYRAKKKKNTDFAE